MKMKVKVFTKNQNDKIEFTEDELRNLLDEIYNEGYLDGRKNNYIYTTPYTHTYPYTIRSTSTSATSVDCSNELKDTLNAEGEINK
jgi:hypothetical protein